MRILTLSYEFPPIGGGGGKVVHGLARELATLSHEVDLLTMAFAGLPKFEVVDNIRVTRLTCIRRRIEICHPHEMLTYLLNALPKAKRLVASGQFDVNHTHFVFPDGVLAWLLKQRTGLPYVITAHGSDVPGYNAYRFGTMHEILAPIWKRVVSSAHCIVSPSAHLQQLIEKRGRDVKSVVIPNGIDENKFNPNRRKRTRILVVTRIFERKGVQYLLTALRNRSLNCDIDIVGDGPYLEELKKLARDTPTKVRFVGWLDNDSDQLKEFYETSSIFVFMSQQENFPVNLLEAMAAGMAIVTSEDPGSREVVGDTALAVSNDDPNRLFEVLQELVENPELCANLGAAARKRLERHFRWPTIAARYESLFHSVIR